MNDLFWAIYWIDILSTLHKAVIGGLLLSSLLGTVVYLLVSMAAERALSVKVFFSIFIPVYLLFVFSAFIPSRQTMYVMLGVKATQNVVESDFGKKLQQIIDVQMEELVGKYGVKK